MLLYTGHVGKNLGPGGWGTITGLLEEVNGATSHLKDIVRGLPVESTPNGAEVQSLLNGLAKAEHLGTCIGQRIMQE